MESKTLRSRTAGDGLSGLAAAIAEPARTRMLCCLLDGHARTSTELAAIAGVTASTASVHLALLQKQHLVQTLPQGRHRYHRLGSAEVARALEALMAVASGPRERFEPNAPKRLRAARTCYDHMAGEVAVALNDRFQQSGWLALGPGDDGGYVITEKGRSGFESLGIDIGEVGSRRRRFAFACIDWSERRPHLGGALGAALLGLALRKSWVERDLDSRILSVTRTGQRQLEARFGVLAPRPTS